MSALGPGVEFDRIRRFLAAVRQSDRVVVGPGDDCAILDVGRIAISVDMSVEDVHFRRDWLTGEQIGRRAAAIALSDLAASAAAPFGILDSLAVPADLDDAYVQEIAAGLRAEAEALGATLLGGDLTRSSGPIVLDIVVLGDVTHSLTRAGARVGDGLWVTGRLGGAACAVSDLLEGHTPDPEAMRAYASPVPRTREAAWLAARSIPTALIDLSDGLAGDAGHLAAASGVRIIVDAATLPVHAAAAKRGDEAGLALALGGGDDYELCFAAGPIEDDVRAAFEEEFAVPLTRVGEVVEGSGVVLRDADGRLRGMPASGFSHFTEVA